MSKNSIDCWGTLILSEKLAHKKKLQKELDSLERAIESDPETVKEYFTKADPPDHPLLRKVSAVRHISGWTDSRKNPISYEGYRFKLSDKWYWVRYGSNWCSTIRDCGRDGDEGCNDLPYTEAYSETVDELLGHLEPYQVVGTLLLWHWGLME